MKKKIFVSVIIFLIILATSIFVYLDSSKIRRICINDNCFKVEIADNQASRETGLMNRESLELNQGMLFVFEDNSQHGFWMKNTLIPLDMIWISENKEIVAIKKDAQPCLTEDCLVIVPKADSKYVLEINSNLSEHFGFKLGDKVKF